LGALRDKDAGVRRSAAQALWPFGSEPKVVLALAEALDSALAAGNDRQLACTAADRLGMLGRRARPATAALIRATRYSDPGVRRVAVQALGQIGAATEPAMQALRAARTDASAPVREAAEEALKKIRR
jgi:HEAT repeat protein